MNDVWFAITAMGAIAMGVTWMAGRAVAKGTAVSSGQRGQGNQRGQSNQVDQGDQPDPRDQPFGRDHAAWILGFAALVSLITIFGLKDRLLWARLITSSAAIIWSNVTVLSLAVAAGAAFHLQGRPRWRRVLISFSLMLMALATLFQPVLQPVLRPVVGADRWDSHGVCLQSHQRTCSAAAGATLLKAHGIDVTEDDMVQWCLTDARGTPSLGLWRGLCVGAGQSQWQPAIVDASADELIQTGPWPSVLVVGLPRIGADPKYGERYGWAPGFRHSVVLFGVKSDGMLDMGDPAVGRETWSQEDLRILYRGEAITMVPSS